MSKKGKKRKPAKLFGISKTSGKAEKLVAQAVRHKQVGDIDQAVDCYRQAIAFSPGFADAHAGLGNVLSGSGRIQEAIASFQQALILNPKHVEAYNNIAILFKRVGKLDDAIDCFGKAIQLQPQLAAIHYNLANALKSKGAFDEAIKAYQKAIRLSPKELLFWQEFACSLEGVSLTALDADLMDDLIRCLAINGINKDALSLGACHFLHHLPAFVNLFELTSSGRIEELQQKIETGEIIRPLTHPLLTNLMKSVRIQSIALEKLLTEIRRLVLFLSIHHRLSGKVQTDLFPFLSSLAGQCYLNEYIYFQTDEEVAWLNIFFDQAGKESSREARVQEFDIALIAAYQPLGHLKSQGLFPTLFGGVRLQECKDLLISQVQEPEQEAAIIRHIPNLTSIRNETSQLVQGRYETNPYPRWKESRHIRPLGGLGSSIYALFPYLPQEYFSNPPRPDILIAGCGTGKQAVECAQTFPNARILAVDLSRASLAYAIRKAQEKHIANIEFMHADILEMDSLDRAFDLIESVGVLHHLKDPLEGWRILMRQVKPGGYMKIGLYSKPARQKLIPVKAYIRQRGYDASAASIRRFRKSLMEHAGSPLLDILFTVIDFYSTSECMDLLFHAQEHQFTLPQIREVLDQFHLTFLGFELNPAVINRYRQRFPEQSALTDLMKWHQFEQENPDCFIAMYQFWLKK